MNANELRIGNLFKYSDNAIIKPEKRGVISSIIADDILFLAQSDNENLIEPITLTEEWLLNFGFNKVHESKTWEEVKISDIDGEYMYWISGMYYLTQNGNWWSLYHSTDEDTYWQIHHNVQYVHQLQNLYFALTGEELEIK